MEESSRFKYIDSEGVIRTIRVLGHLLLVRKCVKDVSDYLVGEVNEQELPSHYMEAEAMLQGLREDMKQVWCEVLAIGDRCDTKRTKHEMKRIPVDKKGTKIICRHYNNKLQVGDLVCLSEMSQCGRLWRGVTGDESDFAVDECEVRLIYREEA